MNIRIYCYLIIIKVSMFSVFLCSKFICLGELPSYYCILINVSKLFFLWAKLVATFDFHENK